MLAAAAGRRVLPLPLRGPDRRGRATEPAGRGRPGRIGRPVGRLVDRRRLPGRRAVRPARRPRLQPPDGRRGPARRGRAGRSDHPMYRSGPPDAGRRRLPAGDRATGAGSTWSTSGSGPTATPPRSSPDSAALPSTTPPCWWWPTATPTADNPHDRITLTLPGIARARLVVFTVVGSVEASGAGTAVGRRGPAGRPGHRRRGAAGWSTPTPPATPTSTPEACPVTGRRRTPPVRWRRCPPTPALPLDRLPSTPAVASSARPARPCRWPTLQAAARDGAPRRARQPGHLLAQGVHPADHAVPRPVRLLHLRQGPGPAGVARTCPSTRCSPSPAPAGRPAATRPCSPWARAPRTATRPPAGGWPSTATPRRSTTWSAACRAVRRGDRPPPPRQRRRPRRRRAGPPPSGHGQPGDDDRVAQPRPRRPPVALRTRPRPGGWPPSRRPGWPASPSPPGCWWASASPGPTASTPWRPSPPATGATATCRR